MVIQANEGQYPETHHRNEARLGRAPQRPVARAQDLGELRLIRQQHVSQAFAHGALAPSEPWLAAACQASAEAWRPRAAASRRASSKRGPSASASVCCSRLGVCRVAEVGSRGSRIAISTNKHHHAQSQQKPIKKPYDSWSSAGIERSRLLDGGF
jgi:hypothetical protein